MIDLISKLSGLVIAVFAILLFTGALMEGVAGILGIIVFLMIAGGLRLIGKALYYLFIWLI